ncbi:MAG: NRDE family protein [Gammaproteobacteria bacterium]|nr:NRDE family protein [Gammaproteobacteria bacterium]
MCLIVFAWQATPDKRLLLAANRDELHARPTREAHWWPDRPDCLAGRDLQAGGSWLAIGRGGRFATVTNYSEQQDRRSWPASRGLLVTDFLDSAATPFDFARSLAGDRYAGFNLLLSDGAELVYVSNRGDAPVRLEPGIYGLANASLDAPWPKLLRSRDCLAGLVAAGQANETALMRLLADRQPAAAAEIDGTGLPFALARAVSAPFIVTPEYGTRCSTVIDWNHAGSVRFVERRFDASATQTGESAFSFQCEPSDRRQNL